MDKLEKYDAIVIGAGAAGMFCAAQLGQNGITTLLLEQNSKVGRKIFISGGGRCNFTNLSPFPERFKSSNKHFVKSALSQYTAKDFIRLIESYNIGYHEKNWVSYFVMIDHRA
ncbi:MAG: NAD(P)/FAD-dependent oxidoreductase [Bdellovibrionales bacterium]